MPRNATSTVERVAMSLRILATAGSAGVSITEFADRANLSKATTHRLLTSLCGVGLASQDIASKRYFLGVAARMLGLSGEEQFVGAMAAASLRKLANASADTVYCSVTEATAAVCIDRCVGSFPIRTLTLDVGDRRPLGVGAGSLALLAAMPDDRVELVCEHNEAWLRDFHGFTPATIKSLVERTRADGYALNEGRIVSGMSAVGVAIHDPEGRRGVALSIAAVADRMTPARLPELVAMLQHEAELLESAFATASSNPKVLRLP